MIMDTQVLPSINRLLILLTRACQLKCRYYHLIQRNINIDVGNLYKTIDLLLNTYGDNRKFKKMIHSNLCIYSKENAFSYF